MAIAYSYPIATPTLSDTLIGTKFNNNGNATKSFLISDIIDLAPPVNPYQPPYKVFTALLTQSGGDDPGLEKVQGDFLNAGFTYLIESNSANADLTVFGAPNSNVGTYFICTQAGTLPVTGSILLTYNGGAPVATVLENTIGNIWFTYESTGHYNCQSNQLFTENKTYCSATLSNYDYDNTNVILGFLNNNVVRMITLIPTDAPYNNSDTSIEIRVYN